jgi:transposase
MQGYARVTFLDGLTGVILDRSKMVQIGVPHSPNASELVGMECRMRAKCEMVAPTLVPAKSGDRVKTDRRDALKLARNYRAGELTPVWVPDAAHEALRDLVRAREAARKDS